MKIYVDTIWTFSYFVCIKWRICLGQGGRGAGRTGAAKKLIHASRVETEQPSDRGSKNTTEGNKLRRFGHSYRSNPGPSEGLLTHSSASAALSRALSECVRSRQKLQKGFFVDFGPFLRQSDRFSDNFWSVIKLWASYEEYIFIGRARWVSHRTFHIQRYLDWSYTDNTHTLHFSPSKNCETISNRVVHVTGSIIFGEVLPWEYKLVLASSTFVHGRCFM